MTDRLVAALTTGTGLTADEVLDVLLLCARRPLPPEEPEPDTARPPDAPASAGGPAVPPAPPIAPAPLPAPAPELRLPAEHTETRATAPAARVSLDAPSPISDPLAVPRALRRFRRVRTPGTCLGIDIEATVEATAEADGRLVLVHAPVQEHALDVVLVADDSLSTRIWDDTLDAFARLLAQSGAFRRVSRCRLVATGKGPRLRDAHGVLHPPRSIVDPSGRRVVLVATDAATEPWYHPPQWKALATWCRRMPTAIVQLLPAHYWAGTAIGDPYLAVRARRPADPNQHYESRLAWWADPPRGAPLPVVTLAPESLDHWVAAVVDAVAWTDAISVDPPDDHHAPSRADTSDPQALVNAFRAVASDGAERLAHALALAPVLSIPLMRVLQEALTGTTKTEELAEVLAAGLLRPTGGQGSGRVRFHEGVAELLARGTTALDEWDAYDAVSRYLEKRGHAPGPLRALVPDPHGAALLDADDLPFAKLRDRLARRFTSSVARENDGDAARAGGEPDSRGSRAEDTGRGPRADDRTSGAPRRGPVVVGTVPASAAHFQARPRTRADIDRPVTLATAVRSQILYGPPGVGKTQLVAAYAREAVAEGADLVLWVNATDTQAVISAYAHAARIGGVLPGEPASTHADARAFLDWLATTDDRWLVVLDDILGLSALEEWWPRPALEGRGRVLATSRTRGTSTPLNRDAEERASFVEIGPFDSREAIRYLRTALQPRADDRTSRQEAAGLASRLGFLPLALAQAAAYMTNRNVSYARYLEEFDRRHITTDALSADRSPHAVVRRTVEMLLDAVWEQGKREDTQRHALLRLFTVLDPAGHPAALWETRALARQLYFIEPPARVRALVEGSLRVLEQYALLDHFPADRVRTVRLHPLTAEMIREDGTTDYGPEVAAIAATSLAELWSDDTARRDPELVAVLRANVDALRKAESATLWESGHHDVLLMAGHSLLDSGLYTAAVPWWSELWRQATEFLGPDDRVTAEVRADLVRSQRLCGRLAEAVESGDELVAHCDRVFGRHHPASLRARRELAAVYGDSGFHAQALAVIEEVASDSERVLGRDHPDTLAARRGLADAYRAVGRYEEAVAVGEESLATGHRVLGPDHPDNISQVTNLAISHRSAGHSVQAADIGAIAVGSSHRNFGPDHIATLTARRELGETYRTAGRVDEALAVAEEVLTDAVRLLGDEHPFTVDTRLNLVLALHAAGRGAEAAELGMRVLADSTRLFGGDAPRTIRARETLTALRQPSRPVGENAASPDAADPGRPGLAERDDPRSGSPRTRPAVPVTPPDTAPDSATSAARPPHRSRYFAEDAEERETSDAAGRRPVPDGQASPAAQTDGPEASQRPTGQVPPESVITVWGARGSGKTSLLAALPRAVQDPRYGMWSLSPEDEASDAVLGRLTDTFHQNRTFPEATVRPKGPLRFRLTGDLSGTPFSRARPRFLRRKIDRAQDLTEFQISVRDMPGEAFDLRSDPGKTYGDELIRDLSDSRAMIYVVDPVREWLADSGGGPLAQDIAKEQADFFSGVLRRVATAVHIRGDRQGNHLPYSIAVCITKFDDDRIFQLACEQGNVRVNPRTGQPEVVDARQLYDGLCRALPRSGLPEIRDLVGRYFEPERVGYFACSAVGFLVDPDRGFDLHNWSLITRVDDKARFLAAPHPVNVLEPFLFLRGFDTLSH
ncbi:SAV_2336 N-terminal domain-related protein [Streptomyces sp. NPDC005017]|uniref:SAV_2336 N-terminal domain-related protein n=1 Tax=Streptomyces sp. NPDC005017 TaxID=3364706 RepID=UPI0036C67448